MMVDRIAYLARRNLAPGGYLAEVDSLFLKLSKAVREINEPGEARRAAAAQREEHRVKKAARDVGRAERETA